MGLAFGNLTIRELEKRTGWTFSDDDRKWLEDHRQELAEVDPNKEEFHIFDVPFGIAISASIKTKLIDMLTKYNNEHASKEPLQISVRSETTKEREIREKKEQEEKDRKEKLEDPKSIWNRKWYMFVSVKVKIRDRLVDLYYDCFINTYTTGKDNLPTMIEGTAWIEKDEEGLHSKFILANPEKDNDADEHTDWNHVIGSGFFDLHGNYLGSYGKYDAFTFERVDFSIKDAIENYKSYGNGNYFTTYYYGKSKK